MKFRNVEKYTYENVLRLEQEAPTFKQNQSTLVGYIQGVGVIKTYYLEDSVNG